MDHLFKLNDSYSEALYIGYNYLIIIIGSDIMEAVLIIIINYRDAAVQSLCLIKQ